MPLHTHLRNLEHHSRPVVRRSRSRRAGKVPPTYDSPYTCIYHVDAASQYMRITILVTPHWGCETRSIFLKKITRQSGSPPQYLSKAYQTEPSSAGKLSVGFSYRSERPLRPHHAPLLHLASTAETIPTKQQTTYILNIVIYRAKRMP